MMSASADVMASSATPDSATITQIIGKRKRTTEAGGPAAETVDDADATRELETKNQFYCLLKDLLEILKSYDTSPSILEYPIILTAAEAHLAKRIKGLDSTKSISIASQIKAQAYNSINEVTSDMNYVINAISPANLQANLDSFKSFEALYHSLVLRQAKQDFPSLKLSLSSEQILKDERHIQQALPTNMVQPSQTVLTLYGGQPTAKQLFSSLRKVSAYNSTPPFLSEQTTDKSVLDSSLPNGISTTAIVPVHSMKNLEKDDRGVPTLGEFYPMASHITPLNPPKQSSHTTTRGNSVNWYKPSKFSVPQLRSGVRESFTNQVLSTGQWLSYNVMPTALLQSTGERRKQRDRALSTGETHQEQTEEDIERIRISQQIHQQARDAALFKSVYSSFAPGYDNSGCVVPQQLKSRLWWHRSGKRKYQQDGDSESTKVLDSTSGSTAIAQNVYDEEEDILFKEAVDSFEQSDETIFGYKVGTKDMDVNSNEDKATEEILSEISELLETLNSYQHIRNLSLATKTQTSAGQNKPLTELSGSPTTPSSAEEDLYQILRDQLVIMIAALPPYIVAKINGDQLGSLNISTKMHMESAYHKGLLMDDNKLIQPPVNGSTGSAMRPLQGVIPPRHPSYQSSVATPTHRGSYSAARPGASSFHPVRPPSSSTNYNGYSQQPARQSFAQFGQTPLPIQAGHNANGTRPIQNHNGIPAFSASATSPAIPRSSQYPRPNLPAYQHRAPTTASYSSSHAVPAGRSASPQNQAQVQRTSIATAGQSSPQNPQYYQGQSGSSGMLPLNGTGTVGQHIHLTPEEQAILMDRQKVQLAQQTSQTLVQSAGPTGQLRYYGARKWALSNPNQEARSFSMFRDRTMKSNIGAIKKSSAIEISLKTA